VGAPHLYLSDFGVAAVPGQPRLTMTDTLVGTPGYLAPEQRDGADPHARADLYSIGVLGLHLLTGHEPADVIPEVDDVQAAVRSEPIWPDVADWLRRATHPDPAARFPSAGEARLHLRRIRAGWQPRSQPDEPVEVFDQLPSLPVGWGPAGPTGVDTAGVDSAGVDSAGVDSAGVDSAPIPPSPETTTQAAAAVPTSTPAPAAVASMAVRSRPRGRIPMAAVLLGAAGVLLLLAALVYVLAG